MGLQELFPVCPDIAECWRIGVRSVYVIETEFSFSNQGSKIVLQLPGKFPLTIFFYILFFCQGKKTKLEGHLLFLYYPNIISLLSYIELKYICPKKTEEDAKHNKKVKLTSGIMMPPSNCKKPTCIL